MPNDPQRELRTVSLDAERRHDRLCDEFERSWRAGEAPRIEDWLTRVPEAERQELFYNLARLEKELRDDTGVEDDLVERFPIFAPWIRTIFRDGTDFEVSGSIPKSFPAIPGYTIIDAHQGGMGVVYKAEQTKLKRLVALKMARGGAWVKAEDKTRFLNEAQDVASLKHPNIVPIYDFGEFEGIPYFTMEYVDGGSLAQSLIQKPMDFPEAAELLETIARAVQVVHDRQLVHRDLKPGNILLTKDGTPKISDFGLAKRLGADQNLTAAGIVMGTASYMPPEQARGDRNIGPAADIYSLGAILYECLTGEPPFRSDNYEQTIIRVIEEDPRRPREIMTLIPPELEAVCLNCLKKDPAKRYETAAALADDLRRFLNGEPVKAGPFDIGEQHAHWALRVGYDDLDPLGKTGWSYVYCAREVKIDRRVVLHICAEPQGSPAHVRLHRQADAMAGLTHPHLERLYVYGEQAGRAYLVLEHIDGHSISAVLRERVLLPDGPRNAAGNDPSAAVAVKRLPPRKPFAPFAPPNAAEYVKEVALAAHSLHERGVIHGAIYPGEIRLTEGAPKLCGFGAAQKVLPGRLPVEAVADWVRPNYQPPEQVNGEWVRLSPATDIYAIGAVLYELLTGVAPFHGRDDEFTRQAVLQEIPIAPRNLNPAISSDLDRLCQRCLAKQPGDRPQSAKELADELDRYLREWEDLTGSDTVTHDVPPALQQTSGEYELLIRQQGLKPYFVPLPRSCVEIGRAKGADIRITDEFCSREHCAIYWDESSGQHVLFLKKPKNGVFINQVRVRGAQVLTPGDLIQIASTQLVFDRRR
jgi:serine/threonine protein kinase